MYMLVLKNSYFKMKYDMIKTYFNTSCALSIYKPEIEDWRQKKLDI
jgi:hypothetical protein